MNDAAQALAFRFAALLFNIPSLHKKIHIWRLGYSKVMPNPPVVEIEACLSYEEHKEMGVSSLKQTNKQKSKEGISKLRDYP